METTFLVEERDLNTDLLEAIKPLFKRVSRLRISISPDDSLVFKKETREEYHERLSRAIADLKEGHDVVVLNEDELDTLNAKILKRNG